MPSKNERYEVRMEERVAESGTKKPHARLSCADGVSRVRKPCSACSYGAEGDERRGEERRGAHKEPLDTTS